MAWCGKPFQVTLTQRRQAIVAPVVIVIGVAMFTLLYVSLYGHVGGVLVPLLFFGRYIVTYTTKAPLPSLRVLDVDMQSVRYGTATIAHAKTRVSIVGTKLVLEGNRRPLSIDLASIGPEMRERIVRHIEARVRLAQRSSSSVRSRAVRTALEAMFVSKMPAVLFRRRRPIRPMSMAEVMTHRLQPKERIYVATDPPATEMTGTPYRSAARTTETIPIGTL